MEERVEQATVRILAEGTFREPRGDVASLSAGSGFFIEPGYIVTNNHVVGGSAIRNVFVSGNDEPIPAQIVGVSECSDLAVLELPTDDQEPLSWHRGEASIGLPVLAAGFPSATSGSAYTLTAGIVSRRAEAVDTAWAAVGGGLYHDAQINPGSSGGPLVVSGTDEVVGINYARQANNSGFIAVGATEAEQVVNRLRNGHDVLSIGIVGEVVVGENTAFGIWVSAVRPGSPADAAGLRPGDLITALANISLTDYANPWNRSMRNYCEILKSNDPESAIIPIEVIRFDSNTICQGQLNGRALRVFDAQRGEFGACPIAEANPSCGNGRLDDDELCDGDCPTTCGPSRGCYQEVLVTEGPCQQFCAPRSQSQCAHNDGCCPSGCSATSDNDCDPVGPPSQCIDRCHQINDHCDDIEFDCHSLCEGTPPSVVSCIEAAHCDADGIDTCFSSPAS